MTAQGGPRVAVAAAIRLWAGGWWLLGMRVTAGNPGQRRAAQYPPASIAGALPGARVALAVEPAVHRVRASERRRRRRRRRRQARVGGVAERPGIDEVLARGVPGAVDTGVAVPAPVTRGLDRKVGVVPGPRGGICPPPLQVEVGQEREGGRGRCRPTVVDFTCKGCMA